MIDDVFTDEINGVIDLIFDEIEIIIDGFLQDSAFGFDCVI